MRIISGSHKGRKLICPHHSKIRPTSDRIKEMIFSWIHFSLTNKSVLDLFAGTGNLGFEALSRSAGNVIYVDLSESAIRLINKNAKLLNLQDRITIIQDDAFRAISKFSKQKQKFDFIFADPPYNRALSTRILSAIETYQILAVYGGFILEHSANDVPDCEIKSLDLMKQKVMGETLISFYQNKRG